MKKEVYLAWGKGIPRILRRIIVDIVYHIRLDPAVTLVLYAP